MSLAALVAGLPLEKDKLYTRQTFQRHLSADQLAEAVALDLVCYRSQFGVEEFWVDGQPHMRATRFSAPRKGGVGVPAPKEQGGAIMPVPKAKKPAATKKVQLAPAGAGLFG
ncbi:hypothetical protein [Hymenobacter metallicola]|uniref:Uncharacterized protein n=1 Tax=Hymenobacter metallicola TaxID=2563114 RepID=A0A4Z0QIJ8_9BACT|nr:hypothetical protein [Hymenobacter metallicola]TGE29820.1 hypothetical protein E5K02_10275 [Hymenobacter metallicola]